MGAGDYLQASKVLVQMAKWVDPLQNLPKPGVIGALMVILFNHLIQ